MRVLLIRPGPSFSVQDVAFGWRDGLRELGVMVGDLNLDDRLDLYCSVEMRRGDETRTVFTREQGTRLAARTIWADCYEFNPHVAIVVSGFFVPHQILDVMRAHGTKVVYLFTESPYEDDTQLLRAEHADLVIVNDPTNLEAFQAVTDAYYAPHAYDPKKHHPGPAVPELISEHAFVGTGFPSRVQFYEQVDLDGLDVILAGSWSSLSEDSPLLPLVAHPLEHCCSNDEAADIYRSTLTALNLYRREAGHNGNTPVGAATHEGWACGPREIELAACGTWFARDPRPESDELFPMLPTFTDPREVRPLIDWALTHPDEREKAAQRAQEAIADRTFVANAARLLEHLGD